MYPRAMVSRGLAYPMANSVCDVASGRRSPFSQTSAGHSAPVCCVSQSRSTDTGTQGMRGSGSMSLIVARFIAPRSRVAWTVAWASPASERALARL